MTDRFPEVTTMQNLGILGLCVIGLMLLWLWRDR